jgi:hypothetical protein
VCKQMDKLELRGAIWQPNTAAVSQNPTQSLMPACQFKKFGRFLDSGQEAPSRFICSTSLLLVHLTTLSMAQII